MPRSARVVIAEAPHHVIQRGNRRQLTFFSPDDYVAYLDIAAESFAAARVEIWAYCTGCLWQSRFGSFAMDERYLRLCARYVGLNPVRAGLVKRAADWPWSSVAAHQTGRPDPLLSPAPLATRLGDEMTGFFDVDVSDDCRKTFYQALETGRPLIRLSGEEARDTPSRRVT